MAANVPIDESSVWDVSDINSPTAERTSERYTIGLHDQNRHRTDTSATHKTAAHAEKSAYGQNGDVNVNKLELDIGPFVSATSNDLIDSGISTDSYSGEGQHIGTTLIGSENLNWPFGATITNYERNENNVSINDNIVQTNLIRSFSPGVSGQENAKGDYRSLSEGSLLAILDEFDSSDTHVQDLKVKMAPENDMSNNRDKVLTDFKVPRGSSHVPNGHVISVDDKTYVDNLPCSCSNERSDERPPEMLGPVTRTLRSFSSTDDDLEAGSGTSNGDRSDPEKLEWHCHSQVKSDHDKLARNQLVIVCILCAMFMIGEAVGGVLSDSLALFTDVLHLGSDLISFLISLLAIYLSKKPATKTMSFGYHRAEVLGALFSVFIIWLVTGVLCYMAVERITGGHYTSVKPDEMLVTASLGVMFNVVMGIVLHSEKCCGSASARATFGHGHSHGGGGHSHDGGGHSHGRPRTLSSQSDDSAFEHLLQQDTDHELVSPVQSEESHKIYKHQKKKNINVRAAFIHVIGDIIQSVGVLVAALIIKLMPDPSSKLADPICTFLFSIIVLFTTVFVLRDTLQIMMEGVPRDVDYNEIIADLESLPGVKMAHDLSVWALTIDKNAVAIHLAIDTNASHQTVLETANTVLKEKHKFLFTTIQVETHVPAISANCHKCQISLK